MKIYLASPFFNDNEIANIHRAAEILKAKGHEVFVPMEHDVENRESLTYAECTPTAELRGSADMPMRQAKK